PDLPGLDERQRFTQFIEGTKTAGQRDERVRIFEQQDLTNEEIVAVDPGVQVRVRVLLHGQFDVAANRPAAEVARTSIGGFHQARTATGHDREAEGTRAAAD